jgi:uncharacterized protein
MGEGARSWCRSDRSTVPLRRLLQLPPLDCGRTMQSMSGVEPQTDVVTCARTFVDRVRRELDEAARNADELRQRARDAASELRRFGASRVWLFGSLAWGEPHAGSDVDRLVDGIPAARFAEALRQIERSLPGAQVDLLRSEDAPASLGERVRREGTRIL